jgi:hypothetical protein
MECRSSLSIKNLILPRNQVDTVCIANTLPADVTAEVSFVDS